MSTIVPIENVKNKNVTERRFYALDFDRCLGDTEKLMAVFEDSIADQTDLSRETLHQARETSEAAGLSFDAVEYVRAALGQSNHRFDVLAEHFCHQARAQDLLMAGARRLIEGLFERDEAFGIVTYGGRDWQSIKLRASRLEKFPVFITDNKRKGQVIAEWMSEDGMVRLPPELDEKRKAFDTLTLIDDKPVSFAELPEWANGIYVQGSRYSGAEINSTQVISAENLDEVCDILSIPR